MNSNNIYELFYETLEPLIFPITGILNAFEKTTADITEIYFGLKNDRDDADESLVWLYKTTGGIGVDEVNMTMIIKVQDFDFSLLEKEKTYEACFGIKFSGETIMREERIVLTQDNKAIKQIYIVKDSVRA